MTNVTDKVRAALELGRKMSEYHGTFEDDAQALEALSLLDGMVLVPVEPSDEMARNAFVDPASAPEHAVKGLKEDYRHMIAPYVKGGTE